VYRIAVFARNHEEYLNRARAIAKEDPSELVTFQSKKLWVRAKKALDEQGTLRIYFAPTGSDGRIKYEATVKEIVLKPVEDAPLLKHRLAETVGEGLWGKTLYALSHCQPCPERSLSVLRKAKDGTPLSDDFKYSYALVREIDAASSVDLHPEEIPEGVKYFEGAVSYVKVNAYERNPAARHVCLEHHGTNCAVCGFNFGATYGEIGTDFIHVHHLKPLASVRKNYQVDPINDLRPVCPNCHAMLHRSALSVEELTAIIKVITHAS
jgi:hypothetical protein